MFAAMCVIWGIPYLLIKVADGGVAVPVLVLARVAVGAAVLLPLALRGGQLAAALARWRPLVAFAFIEMIIPWYLLAQAERRIPSSLAGLLLASVPIIVAVLAMLTRSGDRLTAVRWTGLLIGLAGVALLVGRGAVAGNAGSVGLVLGVALCYAIGPLIANRKLAGLPPLGMTAACLAIATIVYAPLAALDWPAAVPSANVLASLAGLGLVCTAAAFLIFFRLIAEVGPARATVITYINPAVAVGLGVAVLGERLTPAMVAAFVTILAGSVLATRAGQRGRAAGAAEAAAEADAAAPDGAEPAQAKLAGPPRPSPLESRG
jgi:drug/metabolite transporter (DMT)-like permease